MENEHCFSLPRPRPNTVLLQGGAQPKASNTLRQDCKIGQAAAREITPACGVGEADGGTLSPFYPKSWFHPIGVLKIRKELLERLPDVSGCLFLTFTVDPKLFSGPDSAYSYSRDKLRKIFYRLRNGVNWEGKHYKINSPYFVKTEFHNNGFAHYHIVFLTKRFLPGNLLNHLWGFGRTNVKRISNKEFNYLLKYVSKGNDLPNWVKAKNRIRIVQPSKGFYLKLNELAKGQDNSNPEPKKRNCSATIGERINLWRHKAVFRKGKRAWTIKLAKPFFEILSELILPLAQTGKYLGGWTMKILNIGEISKWLIQPAKTRMKSISLKAGFMFGGSWSPSPAD